MTPLIVLFAIVAAVVILIAATGFLARRLLLRLRRFLSGVSSSTIAARLSLAVGHRISPSVCLLAITLLPVPALRLTTDVNGTTLTVARRNHPAFEALVDRQEGV